MPLSRDEMRKAYYDENSSMGFFEKIKKVLLSPTEFFEGIKSEQGLKSAFVYYVILSLFGTVLSLFIYSIFLGVLLPMFLGPMAGVAAMLTVISFSIPFVLMIWTIMLLASFVSAGIMHIFVKIVGGKGSYSQTYKALAYGSTPAFLFMWIPLAGFIFSIWTVYLEIKGLSAFHNISKKRALLAILLIIIIAFFIAFGLGLISSMWLGSIQNDIETELEEQTQLEIMRMSKSVRIDYATNNSISIRNTGTATISTDELSVYLDGAPTICQWDSDSVEPGNLITCTLPESCSGRTVRVSAPAASISAECS